MGEQVNDGGPAFPPHRNPETHASGMSLRDYFAAHAINGLTLLYQASLTDWAPKKVARNAYAVADAMLSARSQPSQAGERDA